MNNMNFLKGVCVGMVLGAAAGIAVPQKKKNKHMLGKMLKTVGTAIEDAAGSMGL
jgi:gas vesicle protein